MKTKITTQSLKELKENPELIYIKPNIGDWIPRTRIPKRCLYCKAILSNYRTEPMLNKKGVCSQWCLDFVEKPKTSHECKYCGNATLPILTTKEYKLKSGYTKYIGTITGWRKVCDECKIKHQELRKLNHNMKVALLDKGENGK